HQARYSAIGGRHAAVGGVVGGMVAGTLADGKQSGLALDHDVAHVGGSGAGKDDALRLTGLHALAHEFGTGAGLAKAAPCHDEPRLPVTLGRELVRSCGTVGSVPRVVRS